MDGRESLISKEGLGGRDMGKVLTLSIAAYNVESFIDNTLKTIAECKCLNQIEVIIIDDGSKDKTAEKSLSFCNRCPDSFKLVSKQNGGYGSTINEALKLATGKYFKWLDGDDWVQTDNMESYIEYLSSCKSDIVISPYNIVYMPDREIELTDVHNGLSDNSCNLEKCGVNGSITHQELAVRTQLLKKNNIRITEKCFYTDQEFVFESILYSSTISRFSMPVYCYQVGREGQSVSLEGLRKHYPDSMIVAKKLCNYYGNNCSKLNGDKKKIILTKIIGASSVVYKAYMARNDFSKSKKELMEYDYLLKSQYLDLYESTNCLKRARILRMTRYLGYRMICCLSFRKHMK